jgi:hypothetical protein
MTAGAGLMTAGAPARIDGRGHLAREFLYANIDFHISRTVRFSALANLREVSSCRLEACGHQCGPEVRGHQVRGHHLFKV